MSELFLKIINMSISASWLVLAVLILRLVFKKAPKWVNVLLWGIVAIRLICPFSFESALSLIPSAETIPEKVFSGPNFTVQTGITPMDDRINEYLGDRYFEGVTVPANNGSNVMTALAIVWGVGVLLLGAYTAISYWRLRRKVETSVRYRGNIFRSENVSSPFVLGIIKPKIYLPFKMDMQALEHVVAHEQAHVRRKDHLWKPLGFLLLTIHWFNPLIWLAYILLCRDIEFACDEKVIKELGSEQRADYTQALVTCSINRRMVAACPLAFGEVGVKERVKSVMNYKKPAFWIIILAVVTCVVVAVCFLTNPVTNIENPWVQEYLPGAEGILGGVDKEKYESISEDFAIGADEYGRAVFKDPHKAFRTFTSLYADGIALIREQNDLPPISEENFGAYKTYGWQVTYGSVEAREQAGFVTDFLDIYENSFEEDAPLPNTEIPNSEPESSVKKWYDCLEAPNELIRDLPLETEIPEFRGVSFRASSGGMEAVTEDGVVQLYMGMPIWSTYFCDLNGDGLPELCSAISWGSGIIDNRVIIYDYANGVSYSIEDRGVTDYTLRQNEKDGMLYVEARLYEDGEFLSAEVISIDRAQPQSTYTEDYGGVIRAITDPTDDPNFSFDTAAEKIYEDERNEYFISGLYSQHIIVQYTDGTQEDIVTALNSGRATFADLDKFGIRYWAEPKTDSLDAAISSAILAHYASDEPDGLIHVESHVLLANEGVSGTPLVGADDHAEKVTAYLLVHHVKYSTYGGALEAVGGSYVPTAITFKITDSGEYVLEEYWEPRDGSYYTKDIRDEFPGATADDALNEQAYIADLKEQTYNKALAYLNNNISPDVRIGGLLNEIQTSPALSSNPGDYIREHEAEYEELLGYGEATLKFCFAEFLQGGQTDLRGHIMALACQDVSYAWGEALLIDGVPPFTGQDWFDVFRSNAETLAKQYSPEYLAKHYPVSHLLLRMSNSGFMQ